ncbi:hypothetical protein ISCGN_005195 [Ixodes scapularis]
MYIFIVMYIRYNAPTPPNGPRKRRERHTHACTGINYSALLPVGAGSLCTRRPPMYTVATHRLPAKGGVLRPLLAAVPVSQSLRPQDPPGGRPHATTSAPLVHHS